MERYQFQFLFRSPFGRSLAFILLAFAVIPALALFVFGAAILRGQLENRSIVQLQTVADLNESSITQWTTAASNTLQAVLENPVVAQNAAFVLQSPNSSRSTQVLLDDLMALIETGYFSNVYFALPNGDIILSTVPDLETDTLAVNISEFEQDGGNFWGFSDETALGYTTAFTWRPLLDRRGAEVGYLVGEFNLETITQRIAESGAGVGQTVSSHLVSAGGVDLTLPDNGRWTAEAVTNTIQGAPGFNGFFTNPDGREVIGTIQALSGPLEAWLLVVQEEAEAFQLLYDAAPLAVGFVIILMVLALAVSLPTTQRIINPLQILQRAAQGMAGGDLQARVDIQRKDEFGFLADSFNQMADELQEAFGRLESSNVTLASRAEQLAGITRVGQLATQFLDLDDLLSTVTSEIQELYQYQAVTIYLLDDNRLIARASSGSHSETIVDYLVPNLDANDPVSITVNEHRTVVVNFVEEPQHADFALHPEIKSAVNIPLLLGAQQERFIGIFSIQSTLIDDFSEDEIEVLEIFARQLAIAIQNAELFSESEHARHLADLANQQKSEFLSNMSHELRTPLNVIIGYSHSMLNRPAMYQNKALPPIYAEAIESIMTSGQHLMGLINDILDLSKIEAGRVDLEIQPINPLPILTGVRATALGLVKTGVNVYTTYPEKLPNIMGDELRVRQILLNLVSNAAKFTEQGAITLGARVQDGSLLFSVADTGAGIPQDAQEDLFGRFQQATGQNLEVRSLGTGLGLSISRELTRLQGGEIWFTSKVGEGTTFFFTIPLAVESISEVASVPVDNEAREITKRVSVFEDEPDLANLMKQILLVDPRSESRRLLQSALSSRNYDVLAITPDEEVIELATALVPDVLVLHLQDGAEEMEQLVLDIKAAENLLSVPLLVLRDKDLTGDAETDDDALGRIFTEISDLIEGENPVKMYNKEEG